MLNFTVPFRLQIMDMSDKFLDEDALSVRIPTETGEIGILANHEPLLATIQSGIIYYRLKDEEEVTTFVSGGFVEVLNNNVRILADKLGHEKEILENKSHNPGARIIKKTKENDRVIADFRGKKLKQYEIYVNNDIN